MRRHLDTDTPDFYALARDYLYVYLPTVAGLSGNTVKAYRISLECLITYLTSVGGVNRAEVCFDHCGRDHLKKWVSWMTNDQEYAPRTVGLRLSAIKAFLAYAAGEDITLVAVHQAAATLRPPRVPREPIDHLTPPQTTAILAAHNGATKTSRRNRMLLILLYDTAARVSELTALTTNDLVLTEPGHLILTGKGSKTRVVPLTTTTIKHLQVYLTEFHPDAATTPNNHPLFYSRHQGQPTRLSVDTVQAVLKKAAASARGQCPSIPEKMHCHLLRKTKAMDLYQQGVPLPIIMRLLGHEHSSTTQAFYAFATLDMMRQAINTANPTNDLHTTPLTPQQLDTLYSLR